DGVVDIYRNGVDIDGDFDDENDLVQIKSYYPFGLQIQHAVGSTNTIVNGREHKYGYNGMEREDSFDFNMDEMDMRHYDVAIGRWQVMDPIIHYSNSPYNAFDNNPVFWADPSGADAVQTETGVTYSGQDAVNVLRQISKTTTAVNQSPSRNETNSTITSSIDVNGNTSLILKTYSYHVVTAEDGSKTVSRRIEETINQVQNREGFDDKIIYGKTKVIYNTIKYDKNGKLISEGTIKTMNMSADETDEGIKTLYDWTYFIDKYNSTNESHQTWNEHAISTGIAVTKPALLTGPAIVLKFSKPSTMGMDNNTGKGAVGLLSWGLLEYSASKINNQNKFLILSAQNKLNGEKTNHHRKPRWSNGGKS
ncbi:MAG: hypothetical protein HRT68_14105, partial [Flavobacteriaceae bacterium]|nr:hypothetical protein [Flavobacteriaceae bacterium]